MNLKKIEDMAAKNMGGIRAKKQAIVNAQNEQKTRILEELNYMDDNDAWRELGDLFDTRKLLIEEGFGKDFDSFNSQWGHFLINGSKGYIGLQVKDSMFGFTAFLPENLTDVGFEDTYYVIEIGNSKIKLDVVRLYEGRIGEILDELQAYNKSVDDLINIINVFNQKLTDYVEDFNDWLNKNFPDVEE